MVAQVGAQVKAQISRLDNAAIEVDQVPMAEGLTIIDAPGSNETQLPLGRASGCQ